MKHTQGNWEVKSNPFLHIESNGQWICQLSDIKGENYSIMDERWQIEIDRLSEIKVSNAKLIAAAPDMLDALQYALPLLEEWAETVGSDFEKDALNKALKAIKKAI
jgi:hypothetical protein